MFVIFATQIETLRKRLKMKKIIYILVFIPLFCNAQEFDLQKEKLIKAYENIIDFYVDTVNSAQIVESALIEMLKKLDPHSTYIPKKDIKQVNEPLEGAFDGIGVYFNLFNDSILITQTISGGPSELVGLMAGDRIVKIDTENVAGVGITTEGVRKRLLGKKGTLVKVGIKRGKLPIMEFDIIRGKIPIFSIDATYMASPEIGYIKLDRFAATTLDEFDIALDKLKSKGMKSLILDLRNNGGGYLNTAIQLSDVFLKENKLIVYTEGVNNPKNMEYATYSGDFEEGDLVILIDENTASASEIVSGAIQDWDRGLIIGRRSFGKGLVQRALKLPDSSFMRLTIARYYTPTGRSIQKHYTLGGGGDYSKDLQKRMNHGELTNKDSIHFPDSLKFYTKKNHRIVYGGGGIMPDIFIPLDTSSFPIFIADIFRKGILHNFCLEYVDKNREFFKNTYNSFEIYKSNFEANASLIQDLKDKSYKKLFSDTFVVNEKDSVNYKLWKSYQNNLNETDSILKIQIKAMVARNLFTISEYNELINQNDSSIKKAIHVLNNSRYYRRKLKGKEDDK